jgi:hypothetical protein
MLASRLFPVSLLACFFCALTVGSNDDMSELEDTRPFSMRVIILTMNRPPSLSRLLDSLSRTFFEYAADALHVEIHVDKAHGKHVEQEEWKKIIGDVVVSICKR